MLFLANWLSAIPVRGAMSRRIRRQLYRMAGVRVGAASFLESGCLILGSNLSVGEHCYVNARCYFDLTADITLADHVVLGHGVTFVTAAHEIGPETRRSGNVIGRSILVESGAWIGANATILPGVTIGRGAVIAAGSVVTAPVQENLLVGGVPARTIRSLS